MNEYPTVEQSRAKLQTALLALEIAMDDHAEFETIASISLNTIDITHMMHDRKHLKHELVLRLAPHEINSRAVARSTN